jgi:hypothetical protein
MRSVAPIEVAAAPIIGLFTVIDDSDDRGLDVGESIVMPANWSLVVSLYWLALWLDVEPEWWFDHEEGILKKLVEEIEISIFFKGMRFNGERRVRKHIR